MQCNRKSLAGSEILLVSLGEILKKKLVDCSLLFNSLLFIF